MWPYLSGVKMDFLATMLGAALGVVAGTVIQYFVQLLITRYNRKRNLRDLKIEAQYNLKIAEQMLAEVGRFRAAAQPAIFANYNWYFRAKDMLSVALQRIITSGELYRMFSQQEIVLLQDLLQYFSIQSEQFIADRINVLKTKNDIVGAHQFANYVEQEITKRLDVWRNLMAVLHFRYPHTRGMMPRAARGPHDRAQPVAPGSSLPRAMEPVGYARD